MYNELTHAGLGTGFPLHVVACVARYVTSAVFASTDVFTIEIEGRRTHGAYPHTGIDPIPVAAEIVTAPVTGSVPPPCVLDG